MPINVFTAAVLKSTPRVEREASTSAENGVAAWEVKRRSEQGFVPAESEHQNRRHDQSVERQWQRDHPKDLPGGRPFDLRRVLDLGAHVAKNVPHDHDDEGEVERRVAEDEASPRVDEMQIDE